MSITIKAYSGQTEVFSENHEKLRNDKACDHVVELFQANPHFSRIEVVRMEGNKYGNATINRPAPLDLYGMIFDIAMNKLARRINRKQKVAK